MEPAVFLCARVFARAGLTGREEASALLTRDDRVGRHLSDDREIPIFDRGDRPYIGSEVPGIYTPGPSCRYSTPEVIPGFS